MFLNTQSSGSHSEHFGADSGAEEHRTYAEAISALNSLQSNFAVLESIRKNFDAANNTALPETIAWFKRIGYHPSDFNHLNIIHVAGTKGKGSTCAFASSILRQYRLKNQFPGKIGLYTSPHLKAVRERIQINNEPISEGMFAKYFFQVYDRVQAAMETEKLELADRPAYFRFLTMMALHVYVQEKVETVILEVGVGGEYDSTNIIEKPTVTGVTSLGIDHVFVLGDTLGKIAWQKAGIFKEGAKALVVPQPEEAMIVLNERAQERKTTLEVISVNPVVEKLRLGLAGTFQKANASLAIALVAEHLRKCGTQVDITHKLSEEFVHGLEQAVWPGRCQIIQEWQIQWCIDGAHTKESMEAAGEWFASLTMDPVPTNRVLYFNQQTRDAPALVQHLRKILSSKLGTEDIFTHVVFSTNTTYKDTGAKSDLVSVGTDSAAVTEMSVQKGLAAAWSGVDGGTSEIQILKTVEEAVEFVRGLQGTTQVLVTGSLHLVGGFLEVVEQK